MASPAPGSFASDGTVRKAAVSPAESCSSERSGAETENTTPSLAARMVAQETTKNKRTLSPRDRRFAAAQLSAKFIERIYREFSEDPDTDRIARKLKLPRLTVIEAVSHQLMVEIREVWAVRRPIASEAGASAQPGRRRA